MSNLGDVPDTPHHQDAVTEEEPAKGARWALEYLAKISWMSCAWPRHHIEEGKRHGRWLTEDRGWVLSVTELLQV